MININELRSMVNATQFESFANSVINSLLDRLEEVEKENIKLREALAEKVISETVLRNLSVGNGSINASFEGVRYISLWTRSQISLLKAVQ